MVILSQNVNKTNYTAMSMPLDGIQNDCINTTMVTDVMENALKEHCIPANW